MIDIKCDAFEKKRQDKIRDVKKERTSIIKYTEKKFLQATGGSRPGSPNAAEPETAVDIAQTLRDAEAAKANAMLEMEEKRIEALKRRQEKEISKIVEREQTLAELQQKIKRAEDEEIKRKKLHEKKVAEEKILAQKKHQARQAEQKRLEAEEAERKREIERKDAAVAEKLAKKRLEMEHQLAKEARMRDEERKRKVEESRQKTEALLKMQEDLAEKNRQSMMEREARILAQLEEKKQRKKEELAISREKAAIRIAEAIEKHHSLHEAKKAEFDRRQAEAELRAKEAEVAEREKLKKQSDARDRRNKMRLTRLIDAYKKRGEHRQEIVSRRQEKDSVYSIVQAERAAHIAMLKFQTDLKLRDKLDNVERVARQNEFKRLQTMQRIATTEERYEEIQAKKEQMLRKHMDESKAALCRKHEISDAMERMRMTNDFTLLDKLFSSKRGKRGATMGAMGGTKTAEDAGEGGADERLNQTM